MRLFVPVFLMGALGLSAQAPISRSKFDSFEVATIRPTAPDWGGGRWIRMVSPQRFEARNFAPRLLIGVAYNLPPRAVLGGADWLDSDHYDIAAVTPGEARPNLEDQMTMLRQLLAERFKLSFHREGKEFSVYVLNVAKGGPKLTETTGSPEEDPVLLSQVSPGQIHMPARNTTIAQFAAVLQRTFFNRPVLDRTGLTARYDFDLAWTPDETQLDGQQHETQDSTKPGIFAAMQQQLGLRLEATKAIVQAIVLDRVERPSDN
jgi:uncharacterized protein (TIGR03435 family)